MFESLANEAQKEGKISKTVNVEQFAFSDSAGDDYSTSGQTLRYLCYHRTENLFKKLSEKKWDYIILQEQTARAKTTSKTELNAFAQGVAIITAYAKSGKSAAVSADAALEDAANAVLSSTIKSQIPTNSNSNSNVKIILDSVQVNRNATKADQTKTNSNNTYVLNYLINSGIISKSNISIAHTGDGFLKYAESYSLDNLYYNNNTNQQHPSVSGSYLRACTVYATIFGTSPSSIKYYGAISSATKSTTGKVATTYCVNATHSGIATSGATTLQKIASIVQDSSAPVISSVTKSTSSWTNGNVSVTVKASDVLSGLAAQAYSFDNGQTWQASNTKAFSQNVATINIKVKDNAGNIASSSASITNIDKTAPSISINGNTTNWTKENVTITITATDNASGLASQAYSFDGGNTWQAGNAKTYTTNTSNINIKVRDTLGNETSKSITISNIDKEAPIISSLVATTTILENQIKLTVEATDSKSGLAKESYSWDGKQTWTSDKTLTVSENGTYIVYVRDNLENISSKEITVSNVYSLGDINNDGKIDVTDLVIIKRYLVSGNKTEWKLTEEKLALSDINNDGKVDITDVVLVKRHIVAGNKEEWKIK
jgi:hypothetical protein